MGFYYSKDAKGNMIRVETAGYNQNRDTPAGQSGKVQFVQGMPPVTNGAYTPTVQQKMIAVNDGLGNTGIAQMQGTSRAIYHALPLDATSFNLRFFEGVQTVQFPFTNINQNRLPPGESLAIQRMYFYVLVSAAPPLVTATNTLNAAAGTQGLYNSIASLSIAQTEVIKKFPLTSMQSAFNKDSKFLNNDCIVFDNNIILPPQLEFTVDLQLPSYVAVAHSFIVCVLEGLGSVLSPKQNF